MTVDPRAVTFVAQVAMSRREVELLANRAEHRRSALAKLTRATTGTRLGL
jgi:hypothetical protein